jgi:hypothetical protein
LSASAVFRASRYFCSSTSFSVSLARSLATLAYSSSAAACSPESFSILALR